MCADVAAKLLRLSADHRRIQDDFWSSMSGSLTELVIILDGARKAIRLDVLTQLTNLTSLKINLHKCLDKRLGSYTLSLPGLKSLYVLGLGARDLTLHCPELRSLTLEECWIIEGTLSLPASLEDLALRCKEMTATHTLRDTFPVSSLHGLTSLHCQLPDSLIPDDLYGFLPAMSALRTLDLVLDYRQFPPRNGQLPPLLPASLLVIRYIMVSGRSLGPADLQCFTDAGQLPELQSMTLHSCQGWEDNVWHSLMEIQEKSNVEVILSVAWIDQYSFPHIQLNR